jgi:hypothetical protein
MLVERKLLKEGGMELKELNKYERFNDLLLLLIIFFIFRWNLIYYFSLITMMIYILALISLILVYILDCDEIKGQIKFV